MKPAIVVACRMILGPTASVVLALLLAGCSRSDSKSGQASEPVVEQAPEASEPGNKTTVLLESETPISPELSVTVFAQPSAMASLMSPDSSQLPMELAIVFKNTGTISVALEMDVSGAVLVNGDSKEYPVEGSSLLSPNSDELMRRGSEVVPMWIPSGKVAALTMSFIPLRADSKLLLRSRMHGPVKGMSTVPSAAAWRALPLVEVSIDQLPLWSKSFLEDCVERTSR